MKPFMTATEERQAELKAQALLSAINWLQQVAQGIIQCPDVRPRETSRVFAQELRALANRIEGKETKVGFVR